MAWVGGLKVRVIYFRKNFDPPLVCMRSMSKIVSGTFKSLNTNIVVMIRFLLLCLLFSIPVWTTGATCNISSCRRDNPNWLYSMITLWKPIRLMRHFSVGFPLSKSTFKAETIFFLLPFLRSPGTLMAFGTKVCKFH